MQLLSWAEPGLGQDANVRFCFLDETIELFFLVTGPANIPRQYLHYS